MVDGSELRVNTTRCDNIDSDTGLAPRGDFSEVVYRCLEEVRARPSTTAHNMFQDIEVPLSGTKGPLLSPPVLHAPQKYTLTSFCCRCSALRCPIFEAPPERHLQNNASNAMFTAEASLTLNLNCRPERVCHAPRFLTYLRQPWPNDNMMKTTGLLSSLR